MNKIKIAIIDIIGLNYDGTTLQKKGIGGSESSIISIAKELVKLDFDVYIFNDCDSPDTSPGLYNGVKYFPIIELGKQEFNFDIVISQRTVVPFTPRDLYDQVKQRGFEYELFDQLKRPTQLKILWQQDTFIWGDSILEKLIINKNIDEVFCISDWHVSYTTNSTHGPRRNFEVLKNHIFNTRNAINRWIDWVDVKMKDPNLFVYNASVTKGMVPLIEDIWPKLKRQLPNAKLKIIGGYYNFRNEGVNEANEKVIGLQKLTENDPSVEFTGIIPQPKIAEIMAQASYNLFPGAFPETSGISTIESINYNTPIIGTRFGAMEESGTDSASYFIDYAIEPNGLFPWINKEAQVQKYVDLVLKVVSNPYLHQQKQNACNIVKEVSTWDTVALQWKQHFYNKFNLTLSKDETEKVQWINYRVHSVFGRRIMNDDEIVVSKKQNFVVPFKTTTPTSIVFFDIVGMAYDGSTLDKKGLGGSESAVILIGKELAKIGFDVTIVNGCDEDDCIPGIYDGVKYFPISKLDKTDIGEFDVVVSSRAVTPFIPAHRYNYTTNTHRTVDYKAFEKIRAAAKLKVFWMHDTFCWGDDILEDLVVEGSIDEIWTLSDFHNMYVMNCSHPKMRNYEVLRRHTWTTRNGMVKYFDQVDLDKKDPNLFVFNSNMSKGLATLLHDVWPNIKNEISSARLIVIGGHYKLGSAFAHDNEESEFMKIVGPCIDDPTITFTGIIKQSEVADICARATYMIYPAVLPETYGISTLEALYANTPLLTCRFGALEETASPYSYFINYAMLPNGLFPNIIPIAQTNKFVNMVVDAFNNPQEHKERAKKLDIIKDLVEWSVVALEWKQHIFSKLGFYLTKEETRQVNYTKSKYHSIFKRRYSDISEWQAPKIHPEQKIIVISPFFNAQDYIAKCMISVAAQDYDNYEHWLIDDASTDNSLSIVKETWDHLPNSAKSKIKVIKNENNRGAVANHISAIRLLNDNDIVIMLDGDDWLSNKPDIFTYYNKLHKDYDFTYGSAWSVVDNIPLIGQPYPPGVKSNRQFKNYKFNWIVPYTHLRTMKARLLKHEPDSKFQDGTGNWFKAGGDTSTFYAALENADPNRVFAVTDVVCNYNDASPLNDYKVNAAEQNKTVNAIVNKVTATKKILIAIPTARNIEPDTFKSIYDLIVPEGYETTFQYFYGYNIDQVRNLIADWTIKGFDYLFSVDSDIGFPPDTLKKLLAHDKDVVSGLYIQRKPGQHILEIYESNAYGGVSNIPYERLKGRHLVEIAGCGFGCALVKAEVFRSVGYPQFKYYSAIDHRHTISEDVDFCRKALDKGFKIWADPSILCSHTGSFTFNVDNAIPAVQDDVPPAIVNPVNFDVNSRLREIANTRLLPLAHKNYLKTLRDQGITPKVIYDIGASVLHWTNEAKEVWPQSEVVAFEAMKECEFLFKEKGMKYHIGVLSDTTGKEVEFYQNTFHPAGSSYYRENPEVNPIAAEYYTDSNKVLLKTVTLDAVVNLKQLPQPDLIKMDIQGAELDVLKGAANTLKRVRHVILELQTVEYNKGAPLKDQVIAYMDSIGFNCKGMFSHNVHDGDYHFVRR